MELYEEADLVILETSDVHGNVLPINYSDNSANNIGLAKAATFIKRIRNERENIILIDNGDLIQGTPFTYYYCKIDSTGKNPMINILNHLHYDAAVLGNHEFNYGREILDRAIEESDFHWLSANIVDENSGKCAFDKPYIIKEFECGLRVGIIGITTQYIPNWEEPNHIKGLKFLDVVNCANQWVKYLKDTEKVDVVIAAYHGGFERDIYTGEPIGELTDENLAYKICSEVPGIDVLLTGHQHKNFVGRTVNDILVVQPGSHARYVGMVQLKVVKNNEKGWVVESKEAEVIDVKEYTADENVLMISEENEVKTQLWLDKPIGIMKGNMEIKDPLTARLKDNPLIEFFNKVQMETANVGISCTSIFTDKVPGIKEKVTMRDIVMNYIYPNTLRVITVTGKDIKDALEKSACYFEQYNGQQVKVKRKANGSKIQPYNYDMWEGIEYKINISNPEGERVVKLDYKGMPMEMDKQFNIVLNNYRAAGGGDFQMFKNKTVVKDIPTDVVELIANYILEKKTIKATVDNNWEVIYVNSGINE